MSDRRRYRTLVERDGSEHPWRIEFGDFDRATVDAELEDRRDHGVRKSNLKIITSGATAIEQAAAVEALNARLRTLVVITWRDESYGSLCGVTSGFRLYDTATLSETAAKSLSAKARASGYEWHQGRCSWIAYDTSAPERFIAALKGLGYAVRSAGCKAITLAHLNTPGLEGASAEPGALPRPGSA